MTAPLRRTLSASDFGSSMPAMGAVPTMAEVAKRRMTINEGHRNMSPEATLKQLKDGNYRFWTGTAETKGTCAMERRQMIMEQAPTVAIIGKRRGHGSWVVGRAGRGASERAACSVEHHRRNELHCPRVPVIFIPVSIP